MKIGRTLPWTNASVSPLARRSSCYQCLKAPRGSPPALILGFSNLYIRSRVGSSARQFPLSRSRARGFASVINQERTTYLLSSHQGRYAHASRFHSSFFVYFSVSPCVAMRTHVVVVVVVSISPPHRFARNGVPLCDIIHPSIHPWSRARSRAFVDGCRRTNKHVPHSSSSPWSFGSRRRRASHCRRNKTHDALGTNNLSRNRKSVGSYPFSNGIRSDIWYVRCVWVFSVCYGMVETRVL